MSAAKGDLLCHKVMEQDRQVRGREPAEGLDPAAAVRVRVRSPAADKVAGRGKAKVAGRARDKVAVAAAEETSKKLYSSLQKGVKSCQVEMEQAQVEWDR